MRLLPRLLEHRAGARIPHLREAGGAAAQGAGTHPQAPADVTEAAEEGGRAPREAMYDQRAKVLKWVLVTCFGYTGYRNARFGRIECHESITAYGREILLQSAEMAEARGFRSPARHRGLAVAGRGRRRRGLLRRRSPGRWAYRCSLEGGTAGSSSCPTSPPGWAP